jgi:transcriptional regulator of acetoin/glycerol metabolism
MRSMAARATVDMRPVHPAEAPVILPLSEIEKRAILEALAYTKGDHTMAAHLLGIGRTTLYRKLKEYRLESADQA